MLRYLAIAAVIFAVGKSIPVDNGVEGDPEIECGPTSITINFNTQQQFEGHVYVKGLYAEPGCRSDEGGRQVAGITLPFDTCGVSRQRSLNPKGVFVSTTVIISFHPLFLTKVDRAYRIQCFYMEADKTVDTDIEVSVLTTGFQSQLVPMPVCRYEILDGGPTGPVIDYAIVGQQVYHKWTCDTETVDTFCMIVHSCYVDDTNGDRVDLISEDGCANDVYLLNNPEYPSDLMAGVEAHVFKFADRPQLYFQCQITILVKEPGLDCPRPSCPIPAGRGGPRPAGPAPPPPANPWPLSAGSAYLPQGSGQVPHGPGNPEALFAPAPGRPDPVTFHQAGAPFPPAIAGGQQPLARPLAPVRVGPAIAGGQQPVVARALAPGRGGSIFGNGRQAFGERRPFDAPAIEVEEGVEDKLDTVKEVLPAVDTPIEILSEVRKRRQVEQMPSAAGTMDVRVDMNTLDLDDKDHMELPSALNHRHSERISNNDSSVRRLEDGICLSTEVFAMFFTVVTIFLVVLSALSTSFYLQRKLGYNNNNKLSH